MPLFSVIIPFHDAEATLPETLASLAAQTEPDWEALLVDDASRDGSLAIAMEAQARDPRLRVIHQAAQERPRGVAASRNLGIAAARGDYIALLDADDRWRPGKLAAQAARFAQGADIVFSAYLRVDPQGRSLGVVRARPRVAWADALAGNPIGALTGAWRRARFPQARMPARDMHEDYAFWLMLLREGAVAQGLPDVLAEYRVHPGSASANKRRAARAVWQILGTQGLGGPRRLLCFLRYALRGVARRI
jgi:teichuronic acid biosynthesis glycosyltransferase TuaG